MRTVLLISIVFQQGNFYAAYRELIAEIEREKRLIEEK